MSIDLLRALCVALSLACSPDRQASAPIVVPFELRGDLALIRVQVNDQPALLILDTGSGVLTLDSAFAASVGVENNGPVANVMGARNVTMRLGTVRSVRLGSAELTNVTVAPTSAIRDVQARIGHDVHGAIGWDLFRKYVAEIDYEQHTVTLHEPSDYEYRGAGVVLAVTTPHRLPIVRASIVTRTKGTIDARLILDLGSATYAVRLSTPFVARHGLDQDTTTVLGPFGAGVGGFSEGRLLRMPQLRIGSLTIERPSTALSQATDGAFGMNAQSDGTIGVPVFRRTRMIVDLSRDRVILEPRGRLDVPDSVDASGISFTVQEAPVRVIRVAYVVAGSVAARAGVRVGDELLRVDEQPAATLAPYQARELLRAAGTTRRLSLKRGEMPVDVTLVLAPVI